MFSSGYILFVGLYCTDDGMKDTHPRNITFNLNLSNLEYGGSFWLRYSRRVIFKPGASENSDTCPYCSARLPMPRKPTEALFFVDSHEYASTTPPAAEQHRKYILPTTTHTVMFSPFANLYPFPFPSAVFPFSSYLGVENELSGTTAAAGRSPGRPARRGVVPVQRRHHRLPALLGDGRCRILERTHAQPSVSGRRLIRLSGRSIWSTTHSLLSTYRCSIG